MTILFDRTNVGKKHNNAREARFMRQRKQRRIQANFVASLMTNLQYYYLNYLDQPLFNCRPFLFSKLPLSIDEFDYFIANMSQSKQQEHLFNAHNLHMIDKAFAGLSTYATRRITLPILADLCSLLEIPIEAILYGTLNTKKIAKFNYTCYEELPPIIHLYLSRRIRRSNIFANMLKKDPFCQYSARALGKKLGVSRTVAGYLKKRDAHKYSKHCTTGLPANRRQLLRYAEFFQISPEEILEVPIVFFESYRHEKA